MSKLSGDTLREGISSILTASQEKQRKFTETIELQARHSGLSQNIARDFIMIRNAGAFRLLKEFLKKVPQILLN